MEDVLNTVCKLLLGVALAAAVPATAADFSFTGNLSNPDEVQFFDFSVGATSNIVLRTWSYAGGVNAAGNTIARGGFDPILALFDLSTGQNVGQNDDGGCAFVAADAVSGMCWDTYFGSSIDAGDYRVAVMIYPNFAPSTLDGDWDGSYGNWDDISYVANNPRDSHWAFDILGVESASQVPTTPGIPEPATWAMMLGGFGLVGFAARRRRLANA